MTRCGLRGRGLAVLVGVSLMAVLSGLMTPASATDVRVRHALFGVHDRTGLSYGQVHEGSIRIWAAGVTWSDIQTTEHGPYDWSTLDSYVADAQAHHAQVTMTVAGTPSFYAAKSSLPPRHLADYERFVRQLMKRYRNFHHQRGIAAYQVWNEGNIGSFWSGTAAQLAQLTRAMWRVRNQVDPHAKVIAPPMVARLSYQRKLLDRYDRQRVAGHPVWHYVDAMALSLYPLPVIGHRTGVPEDAMTVLRKVRGRMQRAHFPAHFPIWATEINYGLKTGTNSLPADPIPARRQMANVARTYLLGAANRLQRIFWFRYDMGERIEGGTTGNSLLADPADVSRISPAGRAYVLVQRWMHGRLLGSKGHLPCPRDSHGTYQCTVKDGKTVRRIYWNPFGKASVRLAHGARTAQSITGVTHAVKGGSRLRVDYLPVMVRH